MPDKTIEELAEDLFTKGFHTSIETIYLHSLKPKYRVRVTQIVRVGSPKDYEEETYTPTETLLRIGQETERR